MWVKLSRNRVSEWINKATLWAAFLNQIAVERPDELEYYVVKMLDDKPKRGRNLQYSAETRAQIIKLWHCCKPLELYFAKNSLDRFEYHKRKHINIYNISYTELVFTEAS